MLGLDEAHDVVGLDVAFALLSLSKLTTSSTAERQSDHVEARRRVAW